MQENRMEYLILIVIALLTAVLVMQIILLSRQREVSDRQDAQNRQFANYLNRFGEDVFAELAAEWDENARQFQAIGDRLSATQGQALQTQSTLLESMQRQLLLSTRNQEERIGHLNGSIGDAMTQLDARMEQVRQATSAGIEALRQENARQLAEMRRSVDERLTQSLDKRLTESFALVSQRLEQVHRSLGEMQTLAAGVGDLKRVLTNVKTRGIWGEMQLSNLLASVLTPEQYEENVAVVPGSSERVEFAVRLPGRDADVLWLPIDSKFPMEDYARLQDALQQADAAAAAAARKALMAAIRTEARRIATKYVAPPHTTDFAVMFLPVEGLYAEVVQQIDLVDAIQREQRIVIAGPGTFAALLNALQMGFRTLAIEKRSGEVWKLLGTVKADFGAFGDSLEKTQLRLRQASETIDAAFARTRTIQRHLGAVESAGLEGALPPATEE
ncbi:MAG: DNA recombination protein RmuC [Clostridia bacterium]|nr:DNA recombination protein RmuC [Clostridia bacterium]